MQPPAFQETGMMVADAQAMCADTEDGDAERPGAEDGQAESKALETEGTAKSFQLLSICVHGGLFPGQRLLP